MDRILLGSIFRKLPLKLLLIILAVFAVFVACFSSAFSAVYEDYGFIEDGGDGYIFNPSLSYNTQGTLLSTTIGNFSNSTSSVVIGSGYENIDRIICFYSPSITNLSSSNLTALKNFYGYFQWNVVNFTQSTHSYYKVFLSPCMFYSSGAVSEVSMSSSVSLSSIASWSLYYKIFSFDNIKNNYRYIPPTCPSQYTSLECQTEYNLIPVESVDQNYCESNNLCSSVDCPEYPDNPNIGTSNIYINDVFHPGAFNIIMNIPEEINWDYAYTNSGQNFNLDVVGYNQDFEKIQGRIETNNYKPTVSDFTNIFTGGFSNFGGLLVATLFVILVFYFIKKMFW